MSPEDRRDSANFFALSDAASALPQALDAAQAHADEAQAKVDDLLEDQHVGDDVASQIAAQRVWARTQRVLDSISDGAKVGAAARDLVKNAPESELPVIAEELGAYLTSRGVPTGWLNGARAQRVPGADDVRADAALKAKRVAALRQGHNSLVKAFAAGTPAPELVDPYSPSITADDYDGRPYSTTAQ
ncbi:hypothetical protein [Mycobacterium palustre]|uniref:hypothetical protein n=1 Tax=Mycobacterium palustre TaxID=153971 RepID=UPI001151FF15|nr:hypothetical protein [Mycobacterium palustre]